MADQIRTLSVNHLPTLTWNKLRINAAEIADPESLFAGAKAAEPGCLVKGGASARLITRAEADAILAKLPALPAEQAQAGKIAAYHPQRFATGLGEDFEIFQTARIAEVRYIEAGEGDDSHLKLCYALSDGDKRIEELLIHVPAGKKLRLTLRLTSDLKSKGLFSILTRVCLEADAELTLEVAQMLGEGFTLLEDLGARLEERAKFSLIQPELGSGRAYVGAAAELIGKDSAFQADAAFLTGKDCFTDAGYNVIQRGRRTNCRMHFDAVLQKGAHKVLRGTIDLREGASGSVGTEQEDVLLLDPQVENRSMPVILCGEENMEGSHGATIGRLSEDMLYYLGTRGIDRARAEQMMVLARMDAVSDKLADMELSNLLRYFVRQRMGGQEGGEV